MQAQKPSWLKRFLPYIVFGTVCLGFALDLSRFHHIPHGYENVAMDLTLYGHFHAAINYDAVVFLKDAYQPFELLAHDNIEQDRPGMPLLVAGLQKPLSPFHAAIMPLFRASGKEIPKEYFIPYFLYVFVNFLLMLLAFFIYLQAVSHDQGFGLLGYTVVGCLFIFNDIVKTFLLTPGTGLYYLLIPLVCMYALQQVKDHALFEQKKMFAMAFLVGLGMTAYGTFVLFLPAVVIGLIWVIVRDKARITLRMVARLALVSALTVLPDLAWIVYVRTVTGSFYSPEAAQGQFAWMVPLLRSNPLLILQGIVRNLRTLIREATLQGVVLVLILVATTIITLDRQHTLADRLKHWMRFPPAALIISGLFLLFFAIDGQVPIRIAFQVVPPLIAGVAVVAIGMLEDAAPLRRNLGQGLILLLVLWQGWATLAKVGPFD
jgi:hypothetical protein